MEYKDEKGKAKKRYSVKSIPRLLNEIIGKCKELGEDSAVSAIDKSIGRGYIGITWELAERRSKESEAMRRWIEQDSQGQ